MPTRRARVDQLLVERGLAPTRARAQALVLAGRVHSGATRIDKPGVQVSTDAPLELAAGRSFVSRAGVKLEAGLRRFAVDARGRDALDVGASTGGFTEALLRAGARRVIALDVGRGQLDCSLRADERVFPIEGRNARHLRPEDLPFLPSLTTIDVSFISLALVLPAVAACLDDAGDVVALLKPQFEVGRGQVGRGGVVRDPERHREVLLRVTDGARASGWHVRGVIASPVRGATGNREFLLHLKRLQGMTPPADDLSLLVEAALGEDPGPLAPGPPDGLGSRA